MFPLQCGPDQGAQALSETLDQQPTIVETVTVVEICEIPSLH
jgi:hypothetical protein